MMLKSSVMALAAAAVVSLAASANADTVYSNIPTNLEGNYPSLGYQATSTKEFGDRITFGGSARNLESATFTLSSWAREEDYDYQPSYEHDLTLNIYAAGSGNLPGAKLASVTQTFNILFRPQDWDFNGIAFNVKFDLAALNLTAPDSIVYGLAFNTQSYGENPTGENRAYNSLNFAVNDAPGGGVTVGTNDDLDDTFVSSNWAGLYTDGGAGGLNVFRQDTGWTGYTPMASFEASATAVPLPTAASMAGVAAAGSLLRRRR